MQVWSSLCWLALSWLMGAAPRPAPDEIVWFENYGDALREAKKTQKPIFLEFRCEA
jgi:hypothetical protein